MHGVHLTRTAENVAEIDALAARLAPSGGGRVPLAEFLDDVRASGRRGRRGPLGRLLGRRVRRSFTWDATDRRDPLWWPQGVSSSADATASGLVEGRRVLVVSWYAHGSGEDRQGSRLTFVDLDTLRYRHVLLVVPRAMDGEAHLEPLRVHAGGIVWRGPYVHVAATGRGFVTVRLDDLMWAPVEGDSLFGYRYVLPVRLTHRAAADEGIERLRYSFLSLDRSVEPPGLLAGEYGRRQQTRRLAHYPLDEAGLPVLDESGVARPVGLDDAGLAGMQGAVTAAGSYVVTASHGPWTPGSLYAGRPGAFRRHRWALPMGPEDVTWWPSDDLLWTVTEHPRRRWVVAVRPPG
ncbi:hypothetical protein QWY28_05610 [Nocardioides sp. SOB77]|uniref:Uncharacterized protein n=1 Tax=Nocardioides oceani TaxID=3058369 RepID=A0ABT8FDC4_9ACTN|nr:hypothetical protein [Nocardioides oceani]MDN4172410.1 hypothetical protein [Nocardioides oceani]